MQERGFLARFMQHRDIKNGMVCPPKRIHFRANLGLQDVLSAVSIMVTGIILCLILLMLEYFYSNNVNTIKVFIWYHLQRN